MIGYIYLISIIFANIVTASIQPIAAGPFIIPAGTLLIGAAFVLRDLTQEELGKTRTYALIVAALALSAITALIMGDGISIVAASGIAFILSETIDTEVYSRWPGSISSRVLASGVAGGLVDSSVFVIIGLSPMGAGFLSWDLVPYAIIGQYVTKVALSATGAAALSLRSGT